MKRHHDLANPYKGKHSIESDLWFRGLIYYHHVEKHGRLGVAEGSKSSTSDLQVAEEDRHIRLSISI